MGDPLRELIDLLLPTACAGCGRILSRGLVLCPECRRALPRLPATGCPLCQGETAGSGPCAACRLEPPPYAACLAEARFEAAVAAWIRRLKYPGPRLRSLDPGAEAAVGALVRAAARRGPDPGPQAVVPVPLHPARLRQRGFDPVARLAREVARERGAPWVCGLRRVRDTPSQTGLDRPARRRNVAGAFRARAGLPQEVWLVDDVVTTGATLAEASRALLRGGVRRVVAICAARTPERV